LQDWLVLVDMITFEDSTCKVLTKVYILHCCRWIEELLCDL
jgi:hypothetical protein